MDANQQKLIKNQKKSCKKGKRKGSENALKVVYISSPMKVKTSASRFRSLVQHLTGKNSDISQYVDESSNMNGFHDFGCDEYEERSSPRDVGSQYRVLSSISSMDDTPTSSESIPGSMDNVYFGGQMEDIQHFAEFFSTDSIFDASELDVLGSYEELL